MPIPPKFRQRIFKTYIDVLRVCFVGNPSAFIQWQPKMDKGKGSWMTKYDRLTLEVLDKHNNGVINVGSFPIYRRWHTLYSRFIAIDIDMHVGHDGVNEDLKEKALEKLEVLYNNAEEYFKISNDCIFIEDSGGGYHIWITLENFTTLLNVQLYINYIRPRIQLLFQGIDDNIDIFPKQTVEDMKIEGNGIPFDLQKKPGNAIRLPFSNNMKRNMWCETVFGNPYRLQAADITSIASTLKLKMSQLRSKKIPESVKTVNYNPEDKRAIVLDKDLMYFYEHEQFRPCFKACMDNTFPMKGPNGNIMRVGLSNELYASGAKLPVIIKAFEKQVDFDYEKTKKQIEYCISHVNAKGHSLTLRCDTIQDLGFCLSNCWKLGRTNNLPPKEEPKLPSVKGWDGLHDLIGDTILENKKRYYIYKTTRSGTTTSVIIHALRHERKILMIAPLINIFKITVNDALKIGFELGYLNLLKDYKIHRVKSNFEVCVKLQKQFKLTKDIDKVFPFFYKGYCKNCDKFTKFKCEFQKFMEDLEKNDLIYLTVHKFNAMIKGGVDSQIVLRRLLNWADVIFVDECSHIFDVDWDSFEVWKDSPVEMELIKKWEDSLDNFLAEYPTWMSQPQVIHLTEFIQHIKTKIDELKEYNKSYYIQFPNEFAESLTTPQKIAFYQQLVQYYKDTEDRNISYLVECFLNMSRKTIYLQLITPLRDPKRIILASVNNIDEMVKFLNKYTREKLLLLTDATEPPVKLSKCFDNLDYLYVNDPMNTAVKQKVYSIAHAESFVRFTSDLRYEIEDVLDRHASNKRNPVFLVTQSKKVMRFVMKIARDYGSELKKKWVIGKFDYFRGKFTKGQPSPFRKMIVLGTARPPAHCYDFVASIYKKAGYLKGYQTIELAGKYLENYSAQSSFFQAISRVKCPQGKEESAVIVYGCNAQEIKNWLDMKINTPDVITVG